MLIISMKVELTGEEKEGPSGKGTNKSMKCCTKEGKNNEMEYERERERERKKNYARRRENGGEM